MRCSPRAILAIAIVLVVAGCRQPTTGAAQARVADSATTPAAGNATDVTTPAAADRVLFDERSVTDWPKPIDEATKEQLLASIYGAGAAADDTIETVWHGAFTAAGTRQQAMLVAHDGGPASIVPFPTPSTLVVLEGGKVVGKLDLPKDDAGYQWIVATADIGGDGIDELLLRSAYMQMGESGASAKLVSLKDGKYAVLQTLERTSYNDCNAAHAKAPEVEASVVSVRAGKLVSRKYRAACPPEAGNDAARPDPKPGDYQPID
jgi:hypothetical protein